MTTEDYSVTGLAQANLKSHLEAGERIITATLPANAAEVMTAISGFSDIQFAATDSGKLLLLGYEIEGRLTVIHLNAGL